MLVSSTSRPRIAMLLVNRQILKEASYVLYSASTFHFDDPESLAVFLLATPERQLAVMTRLIITIIPRPGTALNNAKAPQFLNCFDGYPIVESSSAFMFYPDRIMFYSNMKLHTASEVGKAVLHAEKVIDE